MIIKKNGKIVGILIDWELARLVAQLEEGPRNAHRSVGVELVSAVWMSLTGDSGYMAIPVRGSHHLPTETLRAVGRPRVLRPSRFALCTSVLPDF